ncbi:Type 1 glutamine amidotransferase-like domain-containing protein [Salininema proteolyticum]|uniref:Type 1 glutamine amidotransferase-like domain-containing protein n=1 Tax=Salininema proteolyticum TaxID=1607685 RepID=A0ABV8TU93_9ACTN
MRLLLTSGGVTNSSIEAALVDLLGKPIAESNALLIPTAIRPFPGGAALAWKTISGQLPPPLSELGWKSLGVLELTALPTIDVDSWVPEVREADALLVGGGHVRYLSYWLRKSGLANLLPSLCGTVYVGVSAGSIAATPYNCDAEWNHRFLRSDSEVAQEPDRPLGLVDFTLYPHLYRTDMPPTPLSEMQEWASGVPVPTYAMDDETAIKVTDGDVEVISEGDWELFNP